MVRNQVHQILLFNRNSILQLNRVYSSQYKSPLSSLKLNNLYNPEQDIDLQMGTKKFKLQQNKKSPLKRISKKKVQQNIKVYIEQKQMSYKEDTSTKQLNTFVQNLLKQMQDRFQDMSSNIVGRIDQMGKRIDQIEKSIEDVMKDLGQGQDDKIPFNTQIKIK